MSSSPKIAALILAAGLSSRMKRFKPLLPLGSMTLIERCVALFQEAGVDIVRVVVGHRAEEVIPLLECRRVPWTLNTRFSEGMLSSVKAGLTDLPGDMDAFFVLPVDMPLVRPLTVLELLSACKTGGADVWYPCFGGKRGHPPLIATKYRSALLAWEGDGGLRAFLKDMKPHTVSVHVADEHVLLDLDAPDHYKEALAGIPNYDIPSAEECLVILKKQFQVPPQLLEQAHRIVQLSLELGRDADGYDHIFNIKLAIAVTLFRCLTNGWSSSDTATIVRNQGFPRVADILDSPKEIATFSGLARSLYEIAGRTEKLVQR